MHMRMAQRGLNRSSHTGGWRPSDTVPQGAGGPHALHVAQAHGMPHANGMHGRPIGGKCTLSPLELGLDCNLHTLMDVPKPKAPERGALP